MKNLIKKLGKGLAIQAVAFSIIVGSVAFAAVTFPTATPAGQTAGGKFMEYFNKIRTSCPSGQALQGFNEEFDKICVSLGTTTTTNSSTTTTDPKVVYTDNTLNTVKTKYFRGKNNYGGDILYGYVTGGDANNTYACTAPPTAPTSCDSFPTNWRILTKPYDGHPDEWKYNNTTKKIELSGGVSILSLPLGTYTSYLRNGTTGKISTTNFEIINTDPEIIPTDSSLNTVKTSYVQGEKLYGYIKGGDITHSIYACVAPPTNSTSCDNFPTNWRILTKPYDGHSDEWQYNSITKRIEAGSGLSTSGFPLGTYTYFVRNGSTNGPITTTSFTLTAPECTGVGSKCQGGIQAGTNLVAMPFDSGNEDWVKATNICGNLSYGGFIDWRLPTNKDLDILFFNKIIIGGFLNTTYWSYDRFAIPGGSQGGYQKDFVNGNLLGTLHSYYSSYNPPSYFRCVRNF